MRKIIIISNRVGIDGNMSIQYVFWLSVPLAIQAASPTASSLVPGTTTAEIASLQTGAVIEESYTGSVPITMAQGTIASYLTTRFNDRQAVINSYATMKNYTGTYWDGTTWFNVPA